MDNMETETQTDNEVLETAGQLLSKKREDLGLSIDSIAEKLNLDPKLLELLEKDNYEEFTVETYLKGYLRAYARFLDIDADKVVNLYTEKNPEKQTEILPDVKPKTQRNSHDKSVKLFTYVIGISIVLSMLVWYQKNFLIKPDNEVINNIEIISESKNKINGVNISYKIITHTDYWQWPINNVQDRYKKNNDTDNSELLENRERDNIAQEHKNQKAVKEIENVEKSPAYETQQGADTVVLNLAGDSWIEIYDRNGNRLFLDLARGGKNYIINGNSPFDILLGAAKEVSVEFNGSTIDIEPYIKYGIARFTLPME